MNWISKESVLIPLDFSEQSYEAISVAKEYVKETSDLSLIHVLSPLHPADPAAMWDTLNDNDREQKVKSSLHKKIDDMGYSAANIEVSIGDPATKITDYAREVNADLIVIPSHGNKGISRLLMGSVAERVVRLSHCPVLILKPKDLT